MVSQSIAGMHGFFGGNKHSASRAPTRSFFPDISSEEMQKIDEIIQVRQRISKLERDGRKLTPKERQKLAKSIAHQAALIDELGRLRHRNKNIRALGTQEPLPSAKSRLHAIRAELSEVNRIRDELRSNFNPTSEERLKLWDLDDLSQVLEDEIRVLELEEKNSAHLSPAKKQEYDSFSQKLHSQPNKELGRATYMNDLRNARLNHLA